MSRRSYRRSTRHKPRHTRSKGRAFQRLLRTMRTPDRDDGGLADRVDDSGGF
jgi:hypothetical protein